MLIAIEGIDGSGKTTQVNLLAKALTKLGLTAVVSKEPTDGKFGKLLRESAFSGRRSPEEELNLFILDRKEHVKGLISPNLQSGNIVILDRYYFSTIAYQSARGLSAKEIREKNEEFAPIPDLLFILDVSVDTSLQRIGVRDGEGNDFEDRDNLEKCKKIFETMDGPFLFRVNGENEQDFVHQEILSIVKEQIETKELSLGRN